MERETIPSKDAIRRATRASAHLAGRDLPKDHVRSKAVVQFFKDRELLRRQKIE